MVSGIQQPGAGSFPTFVAVTLVDLVASVILLIVLIGLALKYFQGRRLLPPRFLRTVERTIGARSVVGTFFKELLNRTLLQRDVIHKDPFRRATHLAMFWGFVGLSITTSLDYVYNSAGEHVPLTNGSLSPIRWLGNVSGVIMVAGATIAIVRLIVIEKFRKQRTFGDVWFTSLLFLSGVTGFLTQYYGDQAFALNPNIPPAAAYSISLSASSLISIPYSIHLASVALLLITAPFSAFIHALNVPVLRYVDRLGNIASLKTTIENPDEYRKYKERAMEEELQRRYEEENKD